MSDLIAPLAPRVVAEFLRATLNTLRAELAALPEPALTWHPAPDEWCILETLGHLIEAEQRGFAGRIRIILGRADPLLAEWDQSAVARDRHDCDRGPDDLLDAFSGLRGDSIALIGGLREADLHRGGHHPAIGYVRVEDLLHEWVYHDRAHLRQMLANVQDYVWPHLGATQRFYPS